MKSTNRRFGVHAIACTLVILGVLSSSRAWADAPLRVKADPGVDEHLFLMRVLEEMYDHWPADLERRENLSKDLGAFRRRALRYHQHVKLKEGEFDRRMVVVFEDLLATIDAYEECLAKADLIDRKVVIEAQRENSEAALNIAVDLAENAHPVVLIVSFLLNAGAEGELRDLERRQQIEAANRTFDRVMLASLARAETTAASLAQSRGWGRSEAGFDVPPAEKERIQRLESATTRPSTRPSAWNDAETLDSLYDSFARKRPRDPFVIARQCRLQAAMRPNKQTTRVMEQIVAAASLVPSAKVYDEWRADILLAAANVAYADALTATESLGFGRAARPLAKEAARLFEAALYYGPNDPDGEVRQRRAMMLGLSGEHAQSLDAFASIQDLRRQDRQYAYNYACISSVTGNTDKAMEWLEHSIKVLGFNDIAHAKRDSDLENLRKAKRRQFDELVTVKFEWQVNLGLFPDVIIKNQSAFALTGVVLSVKSRQVGRADDDWVRNLPFPPIAPGKTGRWSGRLPAARGQLQASLTCDQTK